MTKQCSKCKIEKPFDAFHLQKGRTDGLRSQCKRCHNDGVMATRSVESVRKATNRHKYKKYHTSIVFRLKHLLRTRLNMAMRIDQKRGSAVRDLGCSIPEFKQYLESQFLPGMTWENHGEWHIDHIRPLASFDLTDRSQFLEACNYMNMQPLWAMDNHRKSDSCV